MSVSEGLFYVGIDWAAASHAVCLVDQGGRVKVEFTVAHGGDGFADLVRRLGRLGDCADVPVAIERPDGRLVDYLLEAGHPVVPVKPNAIKAWRDGEVLSGAKNDAGDARVIAEYLRLRSHRLQVVTPYSSETKALRTVVRTRDDLVTMRVATTNRLTALLDAHWPGATAVFADVESPIALEFLTRYPTPASAARVGEKRLSALHQTRLLRPPHNLVVLAEPALATRQTPSVAPAAKIAPGVTCRSLCGDRLRLAPWGCPASGCRSSSHASAGLSTT